MAAVVLARLSELRADVGHQVRVEGLDYSVWLLAAGAVHVIDNNCLHVGGPLVDGAVRDGCVICPWHGWTYDLATGLRKTPLGDLPGVNSYRTWVDGDDVWADLPESTHGEPSRAPSGWGGGASPP